MNSFSDLFLKTMSYGIRSEKRGQEGREMVKAGR